MFTPDTPNFQSLMLMLDAAHMGWWKADFQAGELHVFAGPLKGVSPDGQTIEIPEGDYYHEQEEQSAPSGSGN